MTEFQSGDLVRNKIGFEIPVYVTHPLDSLQESLKFLKDRSKKTIKDTMKMPPEITRMMQKDVAIFIVRNNMFILITIRDKIGWIAEGLVEKDDAAKSRR